MVDTFTFPLEVPEFYTRMSLRKYERPSPSSAPSPSMKTYIRLPIPTTLTDTFNMTVSGNNMDLLGDLSNAPAQLMIAGSSMIEDFSKAKESSGASLLKMVGEVAAYTPGISDSNLGKYSQSQLGVVRNPHLTTIFEGVALKTYAFTWKLSPKSAKEAQMINRMIDYIKAYMHPEIIGEGFALDYPYLATVDFVVGSDSNPNLPNVRDSFITGLSINSMGGGTTAFYRDGNPVITEISMSFQEIDIQTRANFAAGASSESRNLNPPRGYNSPNNQ
jgi:hypothetical protein